MGLDTLRSLGLLGHGLRMLIESFPYDYLYGCIGADIIFAKGLAKLHEHSHSWEVGWSVLQEASSPAQEAFAYGYLSHLAADTVAHNHFIPECLVRTYPAKTFRHIYWEIRFDAFVRRELWDLAKEIAGLPLAEDDDLMEKVVKRTLFSFRTDKRIFHSLIMINRMHQWQRMLQNHSGKSVWKLHGRDFTRYRNLSSRVNLDFLVHLDRAACLRQDPIGKQALHSAKWLKKTLRALQKKGELEPGVYQRILLSFQPDKDGFPSPLLTKS
ncbi:MAG: zinc dependent phospholipase C family protein [bacterium]